MYRAGEWRYRTRADVDCDVENGINQIAPFSAKKSKGSRLKLCFASFAAIMFMVLLLSWRRTMDEAEAADVPLEVDLDQIMNVDEPSLLSTGDSSKLALSRQLAKQQTAQNGGGAQENHTSENETNMTAIRNISANDLWAIHDLLLVGYSAAFMIPQSGGYWEVRDSSVELASLLEDLHPYEACRTMISQELKQDYDSKTKVVAVANASWSCLPANFNRTFFERPFVPEYLHDKHVGIYAGRFPTLRKPYTDLLGSCYNSPWPRTCSYWTALHLMAYRADALMLTKRFLRVVTSLVVGGATMCGGCTLHYRVLHAKLLSKNLEEHLGQTF
mmetsp:Transcript_68301/g.125499  ORF Transcript_68301/g.125499 Transcript_68301/m.125499 type:complete len:330 (+) Transcript_68301:132-1121(+)